MTMSVGAFVCQTAAEWKQLVGTLVAMGLRPHTGYGETTFRWENGRVIRWETKVRGIPPKDTT